MPYNHGIRLVNQSTYRAPAQSNSMTAFVIGAAPVYLADPTNINRLNIIKDFNEFVSKFGYVEHQDFGLAEAADVFLNDYGAGPVVFVNIFDPSVHFTQVTDQSTPCAAKVCRVVDKTAMPDTIVVKTSVGGSALVKGTDYKIEQRSDGFYYVVGIGATITDLTSALFLSYKRADVTKITAANVQGATDASTGVRTGLELVSSVLPLYRLLPFYIVAPGFSQMTAIATAMKLKARNMNGLHQCKAFIDIDTNVSQTIASIITAKNALNADENCRVCAAKPMNNGIPQRFATHVAARSFAQLIADDTPYRSVSNKPLLAQDCTVGSIPLDTEQGNSLNEAGIITAVSTPSGLRIWGNRSGIYPQSQDPSLSFTSVRDSLDWLGSTIIFRYIDRVDSPITKRLVEDFVTDFNVYGNQLVANGKFLKCEIAFLPELNPGTELAKGKVVFQVTATPPSPAEDIVFVVTYEAKTTL